MAKLASFNVLDPDFLQNPYPYYERLHQEDLVYCDAETGAYFIGKYNDVDAILSSSVFTTAPLADRAEPVMRDRVLAQMEGSEHAAKRRTVLHGLSGQMFQDHHRPLIETITLRLLEPYLAAGQLDLVGDFGKDYAVLVTLGLLDLPNDDYRQIALWHKGIAEFITRLDLTEPERIYSLSCSQELADFLTPIVRERQQHPGNDLISMLCDANTADEPMTVSEIIALCLNILLAATEPADKSLAMLFWHLLSHPDQFADVEADRTLLRPAIEETLRLTSPVQLIPREASQDVVISDIAIPKGSLVFNLIGAANNDPTIFAHPGRFDLYRWVRGRRGPEARRKRHLAFGTGTHACLGAEFSLRQLDITAGLILDRLHQIRLPEDFRYREAGLYTRGPVAMPLVFDADLSATSWLQDVSAREAAAQLA